MEDKNFYLVDSKKCKKNNFTPKLTFNPEYKITSMPTDFDLF